MGYASAPRQLKQEVATMVNLHPLDAAGTVADPSAVFARYAAASASTRERLAVKRNLAYGPSTLETLDVFPAVAGAPLAVFIHGGYWRRLDKDDMSFVADGLVPLGISVASINYGLAPQTPLAQIVAQCRRALAWLVANAAPFDIDAQRISVFGHSAGGHLAAMCAVERPVRSVVTLSGLHDLVPVQQSFANEWLGIDEATARALSPITYAPAVPCALFASAGERESDAFKAQGQAIVDAWSAHGCRAEYADSPGDNHFTICERLADPGDALTQRIAALIR
jgi:arylformamidase